MAFLAMAVKPYASRPPLPAEDKLISSLAVAPCESQSIWFDSLSCPRNAAMSLIFLEAGLTQKVVPYLRNRLQDPTHPVPQESFAHVQSQGSRASTFFMAPPWLWHARFSAFPVVSGVCRFGMGHASNCLVWLPRISRVDPHPSPSVL